MTTSTTDLDALAGIFLRLAIPAKPISTAITRAKAFRFAPERALDCLTEPGIVGFPVATRFSTLNRPARDG
ncbi:hypothetical protein NLA06_08360 [Desulfomicrobium sp. ZS1]|uniref:hypothetical protein n=1 Tax=Desulfomicrobium sp. ZS1 TaxID=2952228 RepID=UPI0020B22A30|nr:hypothetical protein [Desulfomicrobium sp. ZS1]UTF51878.1 hypothetical protein NLA06_08360 [Desulfomicrobium sp. ZS1]